MNGRKKNILIIMGRYLPGYKDGGPVRSIKNLVDYLGEEYNFHILTCDRDHGDTEAYPNIKINEWNQVGNAKVYYVPPKGFTLRTILKLSNQVDLIYLCGCFNDYAINTLFLKRINLIKKPVVVAAMGLFSPMEFKLKYKKKKLFTTIFNLIGMFKNIYWSATSELEASEISKQIRTYQNILIAEDLPRKIKNKKFLKEKKRGSLKVVWISRITPKKNLKKVIEILSEVNSDIEFTIYGPIHSTQYWEECKLLLNKLPNNVKWSYSGNLASDDVVDELEKHHVFLFPTLGENYGHVIQEALSAGCVCLISNQTPWKELAERGVGSVYPVEELNRYVEDIEEYADMSAELFNEISNNILQYAIYNSQKSIENTGYKDIFNIGE